MTQILPQNTPLHYDEHCIVVRMHKPVVRPLIAYDGYDIVVDLRSTSVVDCVERIEGIYNAYAARKISSAIVVDTIDGTQREIRYPSCDDIWILQDLEPED